MFIYEINEYRFRHEEDYFIRLQVNKRERHKRKLKSRQNIIEELLQFGDYMAMDKEDEELSRKKLFRSRKGSRKERRLKSQGGKVRKVSSFSNSSFFPPFWKLLLFFVS